MKTRSLLSLRFKKKKKKSWEEKERERKGEKEYIKKVGGRNLYGTNCDDYSIVYINLW